MDDLPSLSWQQNFFIGYGELFLKWLFETEFCQNLCRQLKPDNKDEVIQNDTGAEAGKGNSANFVENEQPSATQANEDL